MQRRFALAANSISETKRVRYLLGLYSPAEREHIEAEFFRNDDAFEEMLTTEDDLIDAYARGELTDEERRTFENRFVRSFRGRDRVQFARAFAGATSAPRPVRTKFPSTLPDIFGTFRSPGLLRTATIAAAIVFVAVFVWLIIDRRKMINESSELHAQSSELSKRIEALQQSRNIKQTQTADTAGQLADRQHGDKPRRREREVTATQQLATTRDGPIASARADQPNVTLSGASVEPLNPQPLVPRNMSSGGPIVRGTVKEPQGTSAGEAPINTSDANVGNSFNPHHITQLPLNVRDVAHLLSLQPAVSITGFVTGGRADESSITLDGVDTTVHIPSALSWIRFHIALKTAAIHEDYRVIIKTADGRPVTSVDWTEPLTPYQTIIDTPAISTDDLPAGDYVLLLMGKEFDGSFVKVAEYSFKFIKHE